MKEEVGMAFKRLSDVSVGSLIKVGGLIYKLDVKTQSRYAFVKQVFPGAFATEQLSATQIFENYSGAANQLVTLVESPVVSTGSGSSLTAHLRQQVAKASLTESLRAQVGGSSDYSYGDDDGYGDCDDEDEDEDYEDYVSPISAHNHSSFSQADYPGFSPAHSAAYSYGASGYPVADAKKSALSASLRAQAADQKATQAKFDTSVVKKSLARVVEDVYGIRAEVSDVVELIAHDVNSVTRSVEALDEDLVNNWDYSHAVSDVAHGVLDRVVKIENKLQEEENKVSLQNELDRKLALQGKLNNSLKNQKTGGNKMTNLLAGFKNQFGKVEQKFAFSAVTQGLAIRKGISQEFVAFNAETGEITDVTGLTLDFKVPAFKLPTAASEVKKGDIVLNGADYGYVTRVNDGFVEVIIPEKNVNGSVRPTKNALMGTAFYTVVKTLDAAGQGGFNPMMLLAMGDGEIDATTLMMMSGGFGGAQAGQAGGIQSMLPFLLMGDKDKGGKGSKDLLPLLAMSGGFGGAQGQAGAINPMMLLAMGDGDIDPTTLMLMSGGFGGNGGGLFGQAPAVQAPNSTDGE